MQAERRGAWTGCTIISSVDALDDFSCCPEISFHQRMHGASVLTFISGNYVTCGSTTGDVALCRGYCVLLT
ncbi:unnamed protein product [Cylicocyclus nassatus]|uniref:Uncharacterized protein n=1 Tax=Cylicocyclus nassatus TaxID=53992 RepID=A0AA36GT27_CYLNA|nr:unnamed protein product [Cylicocyclus nassatus]